jgi:hypothetical protein
MTEAGKLIRLYPVPFRMVSDEQKFKKWQWITARVGRSNDDRRHESHRIFVDTIELGEVISSENAWALRRPWLEKLPMFEDFDTLEAARQQPNGPSLALLKPAKVLGLDIKALTQPDWTDEEKIKLLQLQNQGNLFEETDRDLRLLRKLPHDFHYRYECAAPAGPKTYRHKIVDWELGALYWNVQHRHGKAWEAPVRAKFEDELPTKDLMFLMGNIHRFQDQWLIVSLIYPPRPLPGEAAQKSLF